MEAKGRRKARGGTASRTMGISLWNGRYVPLGNRVEFSIPRDVVCLSSTVEELRYYLLLYDQEEAERKRSRAADLTVETCTDCSCNHYEPTDRCLLVLSGIQSSVKEDRRHASTEPVFSASLRLPGVFFTDPHDGTVSAH
ncbi:hypothetical protein M514_03133 [Trichuris suis]|uniref:Uncharacterized protein n=1 Tax=Trichuris suis TaxID=68888 RepID=A0A085NFI9_9BILA|nr:hypothetical protein M513_03133 [Trichuris suis]KFD68235.1 hypothetical protein M514_03133 [Trichuris suis]